MTDTPTPEARPVDVDAWIALWGAMREHVARGPLTREAVDRFAELEEELGVTDHEALVTFALEHGVDLSEDVDGEEEPAAQLAAATWDESKHARDKGKFSSTPGQRGAMKPPPGASLRPAADEPPARPTAYNAHGRPVASGYARKGEVLPAPPPEPTEKPAKGDGTAAKGKAEKGEPAAPARAPYTLPPAERYGVKPEELEFPKGWTTPEERAAERQRELDEQRGGPSRPGTPPAPGPLKDGAQAVRQYVRGELRSYRATLSGEEYGAARDWVDDTLEQFEAAFPEADAREVGDLMHDAVGRLMAQHYESERRALTDHGLRHVLGDIDNNRQILDALEAGGLKVDPADRIASNLALALHDYGYLAPTQRSTFNNNAHPALSAKVYESELRDRYAGILGDQRADWITHAIATHPFSDVDWEKDPLTSAVRTADNLSIFASQKLPTVFTAIPGAISDLKAMRAAKTDEAFAKIKGRLEARVRDADIDDRQRKQLTKALGEVSRFTPKVMLSRLAGELDDFSFDNKSKLLDVGIKYNEGASAISEVFHLRNADFLKFATDLGATPEDLTDRDKVASGVVLKSAGKPVMRLRVSNLPANILDAGDHDDHAHEGEHPLLLEAARTSAANAARVEELLLPVAARTVGPALAKLGESILARIRASSWTEARALAVRDEPSPERKALARAIEDLTIRGRMIGAVDAHDEAARFERTRLSAEGDVVLLSGDDDEAGEPFLLAYARPGEGVSGFATRPFKEAIDIFVRRRVLDPETFYALGREARDRSFTVSRLAEQAQIDVVQESLAEALTEGWDLDSWREDVAARFSDAGWTGEEPKGWHAETVFRTNIMSAYSQGRRAQMEEVIEARPYWQTFGIDDSRTRPNHLAAQRVVLAADDPIWDEKFTPWSWNCRCGVHSLSGRDLERLGLDIGEPDDLDGVPDEGWDGEGELLSAFFEPVVLLGPDWDEDAHPRDERGRFASGPGGGGATDVTRGAPRGIAPAGGRTLRQPRVSSGEEDARVERELLPNGYPTPELRELANANGRRNGVPNWALVRRNGGQAHLVQWSPDRERWEVWALRPQYGYAAEALQRLGTMSEADRRALYEHHAEALHAERRIGRGGYEFWDNPRERGQYNNVSDIGFVAVQWRVVNALADVIEREVTGGRPRSSEMDLALSDRADIGELVSMPAGLPRELARQLDDNVSERQVYAYLTHRAPHVLSDDLVEQTQREALRERARGFEVRGTGITNWGELRRALSSDLDRIGDREADEILEEAGLTDTVETFDEVADDDDDDEANPQANPQEADDREWVRNVWGTDDYRAEGDGDRIFLVDVHGKHGEPGTNMVVKYQRSVGRGSDGELEVTHDYLELKPQYQNKGIVEELMAHSFAEYESRGVARVYVTAGLSGGPYAWADYGFDWSDDTNARFTRAFGNWLREHSTIPHEKIPELMKEIRHSWHLADFGRSGALGPPDHLDDRFLKMHLGKAFLLSVRPSWHGNVEIHNGSPSWERVKWRLLGEGRKYGKKGAAK